MALISRATIDEINSRMDPLAIAGDYIRLEQRGGRWWGLCPFHNEKTASFTVNPDMKSYYCFGCHRGGSILNFVMEMDKLTFPEAVEQIAKRTGVEIRYENADGSNFAAGNTAEASQKASRKDALFELYRRISDTFHHFLLKTPDSRDALRYIMDRGISDEMIERFRLGFAPQNRQWLYKFLLSKGYSAEFLAHSGLFSSRYEGLPLFYGRLMFPISDRQGRVVAFGGRYLESYDTNSGTYKAPKYINSPELEIYKKGETLFAIDLAIPEIRRTKTVHLAEGYMDVIALHQAGITNSVASLGTAFTDEQAKFLKRWAEKAVLVFDSDEAGQTAAVKGILTCRRNGLLSAVVVPATRSPEVTVPTETTIPQTVSPQEAKDPSDILKLFGPDELQKRVNCIINDFDYLIKRAKTLYDTRDSGGKSQAAAFLFPYLQNLESEVSREACIETATAAIGITKAAMLNDWRHFLSGGQSPQTGKPKEENQNTGSGKNAPIRMNDELFLLMTVAVNDFGGSVKPFYPEFRKNLTIREIEDTSAKELFIALEECFVNRETGLDNFLTRISSPELKKFYLERGMSKEFTLNPKKILADGIKKAERKKLERAQDEIVLKLKVLKLNPENNQDADRLFADKIQIDEKLRKLKEECQ